MEFLIRRKSKDDQVGRIDQIASFKRQILVNKALLQSTWFPHFLEIESYKFS